MDENRGPPFTKLPGLNAVAKLSYSVQGIGTTIESIVLVWRVEKVNVLESYMGIFLFCSKVILFTESTKQTWPRLSSEV